ncbi:MAG: cation:proton antiporter [Armatimonadetes bacterium]|nr:cation:proton antiporter [Armatimonadota bacterium]
MNFTLWFVIIGGLLIFMALCGTVMKRLPLTTSMLYLAIGFALGPVGYGLLHVDPLRHSAFLERLTEVAVIVSLFTAGLKLRMPFSNPLWLLPLRLAFISMALTVGLIALVGVTVLKLSWGAAVLLGAILAPTDPVLASDVQVRDPGDKDRLRFTLTGEAGLNDGTAFPFVMLGLGLLGLHEIGEGGWRWLAVDVLWAIGGGLVIGGGLGHLIGRFVLFLRAEHKEALGLDDFLALGLIALSYGTALMAHTYGFLAVFAAGLALRRIEQDAEGELPPEAIKNIALAGKEREIATDPEIAPAFMAQAALEFNEQLERIGEMTVVLIVGSMLSARFFTLDSLVFVLLLFFLIRPLSIWIGLLGSRTFLIQRLLMCGFGIRGIGSIYYLMYAIQHGLPEEPAQKLIGLVLAVVTVSAFVHGTSVTPMMEWYRQSMEHRKRRERRAAAIRKD